MEKMAPCSICKKNFSSNTCRYCGRNVCLNCSEKGFCKECIKKL